MSPPHGCSQLVVDAELAPASQAITQPALSQAIKGFGAAVLHGPPLAALLDLQAFSQGVATARAGKPATLVNSTMSSSRAEANTRLNSGWASPSCVTAKASPTELRQRPGFARAGCQHGCECRQLRSEESLFNAGRTQESQRFGMTRSKIKSWVVQVCNFGGAQMPAGQAEGGARSRWRLASASCVPTCAR